GRGDEQTGGGGAGRQEPARRRGEGTRTPNRAAIRGGVRSGGAPRLVQAGRDQLEALIAKYAGRADLAGTTTIEELGLSSLDRIDLMVALEDAFQTHLDESAFSEARDLSQLRSLVERSSASDTAPAEPVDFPAWNRSWPARTIRRASLPTWILPLGRLFAWLHVDGREQAAERQNPR